MELPLNPKRKEGVDMNKQAFRTLTMLSFLLMISAVTVSAQSKRIRVINIPFSFIVGHKTLPAGEYTVEANRKDFDNVWLVQSREGDTTILFTTIPMLANETQEKGRLIFQKYGDQYFLSQIWTAGGNTGRKLLMSRLERQLAKNAVKAQSVALTASRKN